MKIQLHDNAVTIQDGVTVVYADTVDNFMADGGVVAPALPTGMVGYHYDGDSRIMVYYDVYGNAFPCPGETIVPELDMLMPNVVALRTNQLGRLTLEINYIEAVISQPSIVKPMVAVTPTTTTTSTIPVVNGA